MKISVIEPLGVEEELLRRIASKALGESHEICFYPDRPQDNAALLSRGRDADIVVLANLPLPAQAICGYERLKMLSVAFTGVDHIALEACRERGIAVCNCAGYSIAAVADLVFGLLIGLYRRIPACDKAVRNGGTKDGLIGFELEGKNFGVVGTGAIGARVARIAAAFGCHVYAYSRTKKQLPGVTYVDLQTLLKTCDVVSLHTPLSDQTRGMIGKEQLALMKRSAILINTARGPIVDSGALAEALSRGEIAGAGIDVFETEPPLKEGHPLFSAPNVLATPHVAFATREALIKRAHIAFENIAAYLRGQPQNLIV